MTPQELVATLRLNNEEQGRHLLERYVPLFSEVARDKLVYYLKKEADHRWSDDPQLSFMLSGHLLLVARLTQNRYYQALGLMARGDAQLRIDRD